MNTTTLMNTTTQLEPLEGWMNTKHQQLEPLEGWMNTTTLTARAIGRLDEHNNTKS